MRKRELNGYERAAIVSTGGASAIATYMGVSSGEASPSDLKTGLYTAIAIVPFFMSVALWGRLFEELPDAMQEKRSWPKVRKWFLSSFLVWLVLIASTSTIYNIFTTAGSQANYAELLVATSAKDKILADQVKHVLELGSLVGRFKTKGEDLIAKGQRDRRGGGATGSKGNGPYSFAMISAGEQLVSVSTTLERSLSRVHSLHENGKKIIIEMADLAKNTSVPFAQNRPTITALDSELRSILSQIQSAIPLAAVKQITEEVPTMLVLSKSSRNKRLAANQADLIKKERQQLNEMASSLFANAESVVNKLEKSKKELPVLPSTLIAVLRHIVDHLPRVLTGIGLELIPLPLLLFHIGKAKRDNGSRGPGSPLDDIPASDLPMFIASVEELKRYIASPVLDITPTHIEDEQKALDFVLRKNRTKN